MSTLNKNEILSRVKKSELISDGFDLNQIKQVCYEARASKSFFDIKNNEAIRIEVEDGKPFILKPSNQVVCVTMEYFDIPLNIIARILLVGHYFPLGIAPVNTYADPGFKGKLGIVFTNTSKNYIKICPGEPIAKIEFSLLSSASTDGYVGQYGGKALIWPYRKDLIASQEFLKKENIDVFSDNELAAIHGDVLQKTISSARKFNRLFPLSIVSSFAIPLLLVWAIYEKWSFSSPIATVIVGILTGLLTNLIIYSFTKWVADK